MDYHSLHMKAVADLRKMAKEMNLKIPAGTKKTILIEMLLEADAAGSGPAQPQTAAEGRAGREPAAAVSRAEGEQPQAEAPAVAIKDSEKQARTSRKPKAEAAAAKEKTETKTTRRTPNPEMQDKPLTPKPAGLKGKVQANQPDDMQTAAQQAAAQPTYELQPEAPNVPIANDLISSPSIQDTSTSKQTTPTATKTRPKAKAVQEQPEASDAQKPSRKASEIQTRKAKSKALEAQTHSPEFPVTQTPQTLPEAADAKKPSRKSGVQVNEPKPNMPDAKKPSRKASEAQINELKRETPRAQTPSRSVSDAKASKPQMETIEEQDTSRKASVKQINESQPESAELKKAMDAPSTERESVAAQTKRANAASTPSTERESVATPTKRTNAANAPSTERESIAAQTKRANAADAPSTERERVAAPTKRANEASTPSTERESIAAQTKRANAASAPSTERESVAAPTKRTNAASAPSTERESVATSTKRANAASAPSTERESVAASTKRTNAASTPSTERESVAATETQAPDHPAPQAHYPFVRNAAARSVRAVRSEEENPQAQPALSGRNLGAQRALPRPIGVQGQQRLPKFQTQSGAANELAEPRAGVAVRPSNSEALVPTTGSERMRPGVAPRTLSAEITAPAVGSERMRPGVAPRTLSAEITAPAVGSERMRPGVAPRTSSLETAVSAAGADRARSGIAARTPSMETTAPTANAERMRAEGLELPRRTAEEAPREQMRTVRYGDQELMLPAEYERSQRDLSPEGRLAEFANHSDIADGSGILEIQADGYGFLRADNCLPGSRDVYISIAQIRRFNLRTGDLVAGKTRPQREGDRYSAMLYITEINGEPPENAANRRRFETLIPLYPDERLRLSDGKGDMSLRLIDMLAPIGKGQRGLIVSQPKAGKTTLLKKVANAISKNNPEVKLLVLLIDERPEEVTDMKRSINGEVIYSTFDEAPENHTRVSEMVLEHAQRLVEMGKDVVILMDSITRLARAYNLVIPPTGRSLSGGLDPGALYKPKKFFGAARNIENGGSLTIIATALVDTGSRMDDIIFEEFKGTGNMELHLDRRLSDKRIFPAIDMTKSGTRREELLLTPEELDGVYTVRRMLSKGNSQENAEQLISWIEKTTTNEELFTKVKAWMRVYEKDGYAMK